jgi:hypothetical protein
MWPRPILLLRSNLHCRSATIWPENRGGFVSAEAYKVSRFIAIAIVFIGLSVSELVQADQRADEESYVAALEKEAESGNAWAGGQLGEWHWLNHNYKEAFKWLQTAASQGDSGA